MRYVFLILAVACSSPPAPRNTEGAMPQNPQKRTVSQIISDGALWGPDFPSLIAYLDGLQSANQREVLVFADRAVLATPFQTEAEAQQVAATLNRSMSELRAKPTALFDRMRTRAAVKELKADIVPQFAEDRSVRVAIGSVALLPPALTVSKVREQIGAPDRTTRQLIEGPGESRPLVLTVYTYAGGSIAFAEADIAARPGLVNRVRLDVPAVTAALAKESK